MIFKHNLHQIDFLLNVTFQYVTVKHKTKPMKIYGITQDLKNILLKCLSIISLQYKIWYNLRINTVFVCV